MKDSAKLFLLTASCIIIGCTRNALIEPCAQVPSDYKITLYESLPSEQIAFFTQNYRRCKKRNLKKNENALYSVGVSVLHGLGTEKNPMKAFLWFKGAADNGNKESQLILAQMFMDGVGVPRDPVIAKKYLDVAKE